MPLAQQLAEYISACFTGLWVSPMNTTMPWPRSPRSAASIIGGLPSGTSNGPAASRPSQRPTGRCRRNDPLAAILANALASADSSELLVMVIPNTNNPGANPLCRNRPPQPPPTGERPATKIKRSTAPAGLPVDQAIALRDSLRTAVVQANELIRSLKHQKREARIFKPRWLP